MILTLLQAAVPKAAPKLIAAKSAVAAKAAATKSAAASAAAASIASDGAATATDTATRATEILKIPHHWPGQAEMLDWCQNMGSWMPAILILVGIVYLLWGFQLFKILVTLNAALLGLVVGVAIGEKSGAALIGGAIGGFLMGALTWPFMKHAVAIMGGVFGAVVGAAAWRTAGLDSAFTWSGAGMGLIAGGMLCFIIFRGSVMMYTSVQGAAMVVFGILGLVYKNPGFARSVTDQVIAQPLLLPMAILVPTILGIIFQQNNMAAPAGGHGPKK